jgi:CPA2 family monovalent cation:H+ antiporter-2
MAEVDYLREVIIVLLAAVLFTLLFRHIGLGAVLGYLVGGAIIGPSALGLISEGEAFNTLAEFGVVFLLFTVGLELPFERIRVLFGRIFALGAAQVLMTAFAFALVAYLAGAGLATAGVIGAGLALSSTAIVLRMLSDRGELRTQFGRATFGILLVQDLAVGPFLVAVVALGQPGPGLPAVLTIAFLKMVLAVLLILGLGRIFLRHAFGQVAAIREPEVFAALTLAIVLASGWSTHQAGLSMAFGAFLAGMLLAGTHYRHQVAAEILPFRGLLLGLYFMTVGMFIDLSLMWQSGTTILLLATAILLGKGLLLAALARVFGVSGAQALNLGVLLSQGGEFTFVLFGAALGLGILPVELGQLLLSAVALTMMATPLLAVFGRRLEHRVERSSVVKVQDIPAEPVPLRDHVVIAGFGRVGASVAAELQGTAVATIAADMDPRRVAQARQRGLPVYFGDATRPEILEALGVERARAVVVAVDNPRAALQIVALLHYIFPELRVYARARDDLHARELEHAGAHIVVPEMVATGVKLAGSILD